MSVNGHLSHVLCTEQTLSIPQQEWRDSLMAQEKQLAGFRQYDDIVLWFEHDLFDLTMLSCLLHWFAGHALGSTKLHLLSISPPWR